MSDEARATEVGQAERSVNEAERSVNEAERSVKEAGALARVRQISFAVAGVIVLGVLASSLIWPVINVVETGKTTEYPDVQPLPTTAEAAAIGQALQEFAAARERWTHVRVDDQGRVHLEARTSVIGFVDDVRVHLVPRDGGGHHVHVRSASRVGKGDFGQNARNIRELLGALEARLNAPAK